MYYTPEPPIYIVVEIPPFATDEELTSLVNAEIPDERFHFDAIATPDSMATGDSPYDRMRIEYVYHTDGRLAQVNNWFTWQDGDEESLWSSKGGGKYLVVRYRQFTNGNAPSPYSQGGPSWGFTDDPYEYGFLHPYTDVYVTL